MARPADLPRPRASVAHAVTRVLGTRVKFLYGLGAVAYGVRDTGFNTFLLIYYNQVLGLSAALAGLALMLTLIADAVFDPLIGLVSDNFRSRLGRRHPFLFAAIAPATLAHYLLWCPPVHLEGLQIFWYLLGISVLARVCISLFEVPFAALAAEFTRDYDCRTSLITWLFVFGWWGGLSLAVVSYAVFFRPGPGNPSGMLSASGFHAYGLVASAVLLIAMLAAAWGTRREIPYLEKPPAEPLTLAGALQGFAAILSNRSVQAILVSSILLASAQGFGNALYNYIQVFFWGLAGPQIAILSLAPFVSATAAFFLAPWLASGRDKRSIAIAICIIAVVGQPLPLLLRLIGLFPAPGSPWLMPLLTLHSAFETAVWVMFSILSTSMIADLVEDVQRRTPQRAEGALFALRIFAQKAVSGVGVLLSGIMLEAVGLNTAAKPGHVAPEVLSRFVLVYAPVFIALGVAAAFSLRAYRITRERHAANLTALTDRSANAMR
jgi:glycoside/pentoside/hexuronide:cation symporter, GPH family